MDLKLKSTQLQYQGYLNTPLLWITNALFDLKHLEIPEQSTKIFTEIIPDNLRLGKRVERFVMAELKQLDSVEVIVENVQIQDGKITIGELDCLLKLNDIPVHLEIIYKFYLYDSSVGYSEIDHCIGPNRNDSLNKKLDKLKNKQLPLLYNKHTKPLLDDLLLNEKNIKQRIYFKAQLFIPFRSDVKFEILNKECLAGFYIHFSALTQFSEAKFYIPSKIDWLVQVHSRVTWLNFDHFEAVVRLLYKNQTSPLCWVKFPKGIIQKFFVVWW